MEAGMEELFSLYEKCVQLARKERCKVEDIILCLETIRLDKANKLTKAVDANADQDA